MEMGNGQRKKDKSERRKEDDQSDVRLESLRIDSPRTPEAKTSIHYKKIFEKKLQLTESARKARKFECKEIDDMTQCRFSTQKAITRNVLLIGDTRSGKSCFIEVLKDMRYFPEDILTSETEHPKKEEIMIKYKDNNITLNIVDTPGFSEERGTGINRSDQVIATEIIDDARSFYTDYHLVLIVISNSSRLQSKKSIMKCYNNIVSDCGANVGLLITGADDMTKDDEVKLLQQYKALSDFNWFIEFASKGTFFTGCLTSNIVKDESQTRHFYSVQEERICKFLDTVIDCVPFNLVKGTGKMLDIRQSVTLSVHRLERSKAIHPIKSDEVKRLFADLTQNLETISPGLSREEPNEIYNRIRDKLEEKGVNPDIYDDTIKELITQMSNFNLMRTDYDMNITDQGLKDHLKLVDKYEHMMLMQAIEAEDVVDDLTQYISTLESSKTRFMQVIIKLRSQTIIPGPREPLPLIKKDASMNSITFTKNKKQ